MDWTYRPPAPGERRRLADRYLVGLAVCLLGYALFGRAFAYLGVPPLFIGEAMLVLGLLAVPWPGRRARWWCRRRWARPSCSWAGPPCGRSRTSAATASTPSATRWWPATSCSRSSWWGS